MPSTRRVRKSIGSHISLKNTMDKENATVDVASTLAANRQKSRSKSMGPGGLDASVFGHGSRRAVSSSQLNRSPHNFTQELSCIKSIANPMPRSILKPTAYSVQEIPPLKTGTLRMRKSGEPRSSARKSRSSHESSINSSKVALRTEGDQQAAAREREEQDRRDARRKSLANRRVSFAAEATLHTFHEIDYLQDSTTSTDSTRRTSSMNTASSLGTVPKSPDQRMSGRHHAALPAVSFTGNDDDTIGSTIYSSDSEPADAVEEDDIEENSGSSSDSDDGTMMTVVTEEVTGTTISSERFDSDDETSTLDRALRAAAQRAGTQRLDAENTEDRMSEDGEEVIPSFGWIKKSNLPDSNHEVQQLPNADDETEMDMDMTTAVGKVIRPQDATQSDPEQDMSMDVTQALGGILSQQTIGRPTTWDMPIKFDDVTTNTKATMEFTTAIGGIHQPGHMDQDDTDTNEDFSMEFTVAMGGILPQWRKDRTAARDSPTRSGVIDSGDAEATMDLTVAHGGIVPLRTAEETADTADEVTIAMDLTAAVGEILGDANMTPQSFDKAIAEDGICDPSRSSKVEMEIVAKKTPTRRSSRLSANLGTSTPLDKPESPGLSAFKGKGLRRSTEPQTPDTVSSPLRTPSPSPPKPSTPQTQSQDTSSVGCRRRLTRSKSPRSTTPQQKSLAKTPTSPSSRRSPRSKVSLFRDDAKTGSRTPTVVLTPQTRRLSGLGADKCGLGSSQVTALFERRCSIGESAAHFVPGKREVLFEEPELDTNRIEEKTEGQGGEAVSSKPMSMTNRRPQDKDATVSLREMIDSLSPKLKPLKGRKSLHVGSAKGLLGKRPAELDDGEDTEENDGLKRLKGPYGSPVKNIKLRQEALTPEPIGRSMRSKRQSLGPSVIQPMHGLSSPLKSDRLSQTIHEMNFQQDKSDQQDGDSYDGRIKLQDFLNMTSIRFMDLTTTKRRHTIVPKGQRGGSSAGDEESMTLERCVVAGACTIPMLELYQHCCRELKNYIADGRRIVKEIEDETFQINPPLFQEYMSAAPDVKALMDNQFKNVRTHARLLSKAMWYKWRTELHEGLKQGLVNIAEGMDEDEAEMKRQEDLLAEVLPRIVASLESLQEEGSNLEEAAKELDDCDPVELEAVRNKLKGLNAENEQTKKLLAQLRERLDHADSEVERLDTAKRELKTTIQQSEEIREACRGWTGSEVESLKGEPGTCPYFPA